MATGLPATQGVHVFPASEEAQSMSDGVDRLRALLGEATPGPWQVNDAGIETVERNAIGSKASRQMAAAYPIDLAWEGSAKAADLALIVAAVNALPLLLDIAEAAQRLSDKRTADSDGFWVSLREMRYLDTALAALDAGGPR